MINLFWLAVVIVIALWFVWQFYKHEVRPYRHVRQCTCHPRRSRGDRLSPPTKGPPWRA